MKTTTFNVLAALLLSTGCAVSGEEARERYYGAVERKLAGDARGFHDELTRLSLDAPETRAGRRARSAVAGGVDAVTGFAVVGILAAVAIPNFIKYQKQSAAAGLKAELRSLAVQMEVYRAEHQRYCRTFAECQFVPTADYVFMLGGDMVHAPSLAEPELLKVQALSLLESMGIEPVVTNDGFVVVAVGNADSDADLDVWTLDEQGQIFNVLVD